MKVPAYKHPPIGSIKTLAEVLQTTPENLQYFASNVEKYIKPNPPKTKPNGKIRQTYRVEDPLQSIHVRMKKQLFYNVFYPDYLQGGIKDKDNPKDYISSATYHAGRKYVNCEDISDFFPSILEDLVLKMWQYFFCFPPDVAKLLTKLTTYNGFIPQGAVTSSYIANLIFWDKEPEIEDNLRRKGIYYSRYVDDITISTNKNLSKKEINGITSSIYGMLFSANVKPNRQKREVYSRGKQISIHNLNADRKKPTMSKKNRNKVRAAVFQCEILARESNNSDEYVKLYNSVRGKVASMKRLHPILAKKLLLRLDKIKPEKL
jgi:hypothetical protein